MKTDDYDKYINQNVKIVLSIGLGLFAMDLTKTVCANPSTLPGCLLGLVMWWLIFWFPVKALVVTADTVAKWKERHPGEPMFRSRAITEYDRDFVNTVGAVAAKGISSGMRNSDTIYLHASDRKGIPTVDRLSD